MFFFYIWDTISKVKYFLHKKSMLFCVTFRLHKNVISFSLLQNAKSFVDFVSRSTLTSESSSCHYELFHLFISSPIKGTLLLRKISIPRLNKSLNLKLNVSRKNFFWLILSYLCDQYRASFKNLWKGLNCVETNFKWKLREGLSTILYLFLFHCYYSTLI